MAAILGFPKLGARGAVILTTAECELIERNSDSLSRSLIRRLSNSEEYEKLKLLQKRLLDLRTHYIFGVHFNSWKAHYYSPFVNSFVDFYLGTRKVSWAVRRRSSVILTTSSFMIPSNFKSSDSKSFDVAYIATDSPDKNWNRFFKVSKKLLESDDNLRILAIQTSKSGQSTQQNYINKNLSQWVGNRLTHVVVKVDGSTKGLSPDTIGDYLSKTKVFVHFSKREGQSTVISEASLSGCKIALYPSLKILSVALPKVDYFRIMLPGAEAYVIKKLIKMNYEFSASQHLLYDFFGEVPNITKLQSGVHKICGENVNLDSLSNLKFRLPAHTDDQVVWYKSKRKGSQSLKTLKDLDELVTFLEEKSQPNKLETKSVKTAEKATSYQ